MVHCSNILTQLQSQFFTTGHLLTPVWYLYLLKCQLNIYLTCYTNSCGEFNLPHLIFVRYLIWPPEEQVQSITLINYRLEIWDINDSLWTALILRNSQIFQREQFHFGTSLGFLLNKHWSVGASAIFFNQLNWWSKTTWTFSSYIEHSHKKQGGLIV